ncbi:DUF998 domain-containing protein [Lacisediminihabitans sp.]|uniref:DUF998 domain-containing protein n=1 Tax=Lacisediminihabitans sp. TaxID=2787631 RepID=UPI00374D75A6
MTATPLPTRRSVEVAGTLVGSAFVLAALVIIWVARVSQGRDLYVSELGAPGQPTARWFQGALLLIVVGGSLIAYAARGIRSRVPLLSVWAPAVSLWIGCGFFLVASQVTCTSGCPLPVGASFTWQDFVHTVVAVLAFAAACLGMLQVSFAVGHRSLARFSLGAGVAVALIAGAGGILSLARFQADFGSRLELAATTIALAWLLTLGVMMAVRSTRSVAVPVEQEIALTVG